MTTFKGRLAYGVSNELAARASENFKSNIKSAHNEEVTILIPVPGTPARLKDRGFNQSKIIAESIADSIGEGIVVIDILKRKDSAAQKNLSRGERLRLGPDDFYIDESTATLPKRSRIIIVDDVCTTGTTLERCAAVLSEFGRRSISALALFRGKPVQKK